LYFDLLVTSSPSSRGRICSALPLFGHVYGFRVATCGCSPELSCFSRHFRSLEFRARFARFLYVILVRLSLEMSFELNSHTYFLLTSPTNREV
jgi:hypothetical protein